MAINAGLNLPWSGQAVRVWADTLADLIDAGLVDVRVDLEHHALGSDDVTFRIRRNAATGDQDAAP